MKIDYERLKLITEEYKKHGLELTLEDMFECIMNTGSTDDIDRKFSFHENILGI